jgi:glucose-6-phosphate-specific signal transduction histidine kinase
MMKWKSLVLGAATFAATHLVVVAKWGAWFGGQREPWFLNSGGALGFTALCLLGAGFVASASWARHRVDVIAHGVNVAAGAALAMIVVLIAVGPGTIFPIVSVFGGMIVLFSAGVGSLIAWPFKPQSG